MFSSAIGERISFLKVKWLENCEIKNYSLRIKQSRRRKLRRLILNIYLKQTGANWIPSVHFHNNNFIFDLAQFSRTTTITIHPHSHSISLAFRSQDQDNSLLCKRHSRLAADQVDSKILFKTRMKFSKKKFVIINFWIVIIFCIAV